MYIKSVHIQNIRSISELTLDFGDDEAKMAGWHVLIGENGSGKTTILRSIALGLVPYRDFLVLKIVGGNYVSNFNSKNEISIGIRIQNLYDHFELSSQVQTEEADIKLVEPPQNVGSNVGFHRYDVGEGILVTNASFAVDSSGTFATPYLQLLLEKENKGFFSCAFGPFRRFKGGNDSWNDVYDSNPRAAAHMSLFGEDVALTQIEPWLNYLHQEELEEKRESIVLRNIKTLLNDRGLLPDGVKLEKINRDGLFFKDGNGQNISLYQLSDGYRSVLSLTMELIRQLLRVYGEEKVFANIESGGSTIDLPGVVLIDEIDAHLHPTWQTQIGQWFTKYFPKLQFIVTTHSPLICRACGDTGRIWHLRAPGSEEDYEPVVGAKRDRLVYGDILDAYDTDLFGEDIERGKEGVKLRDTYRDLSYKERYGVEMTTEEKAEFERLGLLFKFNVAGNRSRVK